MKRVKAKARGRSQDSQGSVFLLALFLMTFLGVLAGSQALLTQKNIKQSNFMLSHAELYKYAESGIDLARHDLRYGLSGGVTSPAPPNGSPRMT